ncbi:hypothetical protein M0R45_016850 [Rubus argutus]|uniref:FBD domain-containing protein n=1 Tax=Rubus argutus TaxID=59490 RepID=A0AAW1XTV4_RUBAR
MGSMVKPRARNQDRISELSGELVHRVFSFLPTVDAVRTTVLSKRWNKMWTKLETLDFDNKREFRKYKGVTSFATFVSRVLYFRDSSEIHKFRLNISCDCEYSPCIEDWICTAVWRNVVELDLCIKFSSGEETFMLPECIFRCKMLRVLKMNLTPWMVTCDPPTSGSFPSLKFLHVSVSEPEDEVMQKLFSCCPVLEGLTIDGTIEGDTRNGVNYNFKISAPELKTLSISLENIWELLDVSIDAPKLENFDLKRLGLTNCFFMGSAKSLVNASIAFREHFEVVYNYDLSNFAMGLLDQVSNVKSLSLSTHCLEDWHLPAFRNVNQLRLDFWDRSCWESLAVFLNSAPNLEHLVLEDRTEGHKEFSALHWNPPKYVPICLSSHLKTISFKGFKGLPVEMEMVKYLLKNGHLLNKMTIFTGLRLSYAKQEELYREFMMFHRETTCHVEFMQLQV